MATLLKDGRWQARRRTTDGRRLVAHSRQSEAAAESAADELLAEWTSRDNEYLHVGPHTLLTFAQAVWEPTTRHLAPLTRQTYESTFVNHVRPYLGDVPLSDLRLQRLQAWVNGLASSGKRGRNKDRTGEPLGAKKVREARDLLTGILDLAVAEGEIATNPSRLTKVPPKVAKRVRVLTLSKALEISESTRGSRLHAPAVLAMVLGLRRGEIAGLRWSDLDRLGLTLTVHEQIIQAKGGATRSGVKTAAGRRVLPLTTDLLEVIDACGNLDHDYIAGWRGFAFMPPDKITQDWTEARQRLEMPDWTFHDLRHGAASILHAMGVDLITISRILGHAKIDATLLYVDSHKERVSKALGDVARAFVRR